MKTCSRCLRVLFLDSFARCAKAPDGKQSYCRDCKRAYARHWLRTASAETLERHRRLRKIRRPRYAAKERKQHREWLRANPGRVRHYDAKRRQSTERKAWQAAYWKEWKLRHPEQARAISRRGALNRRARLLDAWVESVEPLVVFDRDDGVCGICGEDVDPADWHLDHIVPLAAGGEHSYANTQVAHPTCNISKGGQISERAAA